MTRLVPVESLKTNFVSEYHLSSIGDVVFPDDYNVAANAPVCLGENNIHSDCVVVAAINATIRANALKGIFEPVPDNVPFDLFVKLGGMPADEGMDPAILFNYWMRNPINGYILKKIEYLLLYDVEGIKKAIVDTGFVYFTAQLTLAQMNQIEWMPVTAPPEGGHATILTGWTAGLLFEDSTWGTKRIVSSSFVENQGMNLWRLELQLQETTDMNTPLPPGPESGDHPQLPLSGGSIAGTETGAEETPSETEAGPLVDPAVVSVGATAALDAGPFSLKPFSPAKSNLLMKFENYLHGVPDAFSHDEAYMVEFITGKYKELHS